MKRFVGLFAILVTLAPCGAVALAQQPTKLRRIGVLSATSPSTIAARLDAFRRGLRELGYVEGKKIVVEYRYADGRWDRVAALAAELVRLTSSSSSPEVQRPLDPPGKRPQLFLS